LIIWVLLLPFSFMSVFPEAPSLVQGWLPGARLLAKGRR
jgi:hypothetical protein